MTAPPPVPAQATGDVSDLLNRIFNSSNWRGEVEKTVKKNVRLSEKLRLQQIVLDKFGAKFNLDTGEPKEGRLLSKDDAAMYDAFVALKVKPEDLVKLVKEHGELKVKDDERQQEEKFGDAAEALGYENVPALTRWLMREKLVLEFKDQRLEEEQEDGTRKKVLKRMPYVKAAGDEKAVPEPLEDYIEREVPEFVDIFKTVPVGDEDEEVGGSAEDESNLSDDELVRRAQADAQKRVAKPQRGVRVPATRSARSDNGSNRDAKQLEKLEKEARSNPIYRV